MSDLTLRNTLAEIVLETSKEELVEALGEEEFAAEAKRGRDLVQKALREAGAALVSEDAGLQE